MRLTAATPCTSSRTASYPPIRYPDARQPGRGGHSAGGTGRRSKAAPTRPQAMEGHRRSQGPRHGTLPALLHERPPPRQASAPHTPPAAQPLTLCRIATAHNASPSGLKASRFRTGRGVPYGRILPGHARSIDTLPRVYAWVGYGMPPSASAA